LLRRDLVSAENFAGSSHHLCGVALTQECARAQQSYEVTVQNGVAMERGTAWTLNADIYRPKAEGKFPVIMMRTPYDKSVGWSASPASRSTHGYIVIIQDVRGRYTSEGKSIHSATSLPTATTRLNGLPRCRTRTQSGMMGGFLCRRDANRLPRLYIRRILRESARW